MRLAARGARDMDGGEVEVTDPGEVGLLRAQAVRIYIESFVGAALLTGLSLLAAVWLAR
ncbi:MAG: hypothetical protein ACREJ9_07070 [Candidatus Rokuibacteriota bacterium]